MPEGLRLKGWVLLALKIVEDSCSAFCGVTHAIGLCRILDRPCGIAGASAANHSLDQPKDGSCTNQQSLTTQVGLISATDTFLA
ncbi:hypothetical protein [Ruegeria sp. HKCCA4812]|uniref:hypothetical protein n=1 Tax=Ruegeria sp. HKCCA4812 TaxID=2682993 RepID=UPI001488CA88|nr:hypothetical protein [Ruegeria sp. HKCCA4812]